jgi:hypothetical protein
MSDFQSYSQGNFSNLQEKSFPDIQSEKERILAGTEELKKELLVNWKKNYALEQVFPSAILALPKELVEFLLSLEVSNTYENIAKKCSLDSQQRSLLAQLIWKISLEKKWDEIEKVLRENFNLQGNLFSVLYQAVYDGVLARAREFSKKGNPIGVYRAEQQQNIEKKNISLSLSEALQRYPKMAEQLIGLGMLKLKYFPQPVNPSIKNWMVDYHDFLGAGKHNAVERTDYLFHSDNGKKVTAFERRKLMEIFRSLEEGTALAIDNETQKIIFDLKGDFPVSASVPASVNVVHSIFSSPTKSAMHDFSGQGEYSLENEVNKMKNSGDMAAENLAENQISQHDVFAPRKENLVQNSALQNAGENFQASTANQFSNSANMRLEKLRDFYPKNMTKEVSDNFEKRNIENEILEKKMGIGSENYYAPSQGSVFKENNNFKEIKNTQIENEQKDIRFESPQKLPTEREQIVQPISTPPSSGLSQPTPQKQTENTLQIKPANFQMPNAFNIKPVKINPEFTFINNRSAVKETFATRGENEILSSQEDKKEISENISDDDNQEDLIKGKGDQLASKNQTISPQNRQNLISNFSQNRAPFRITAQRDEFAPRGDSAKSNLINPDPKIKGNVVDLSK